jgi:hypothetical protein
MQQKLDTFPLSKQTVKLLRKAYVDARYKPGYVITADELSQLSHHVETLKRIGELFCIEKINQFNPITKEVSGHKGQT